MRKAKYIKTSDGNIIVFSIAIEHASFKHFNPVSAGFIQFGVNDDEECDCTCYGKSWSLGISSAKEDSMLAKMQIIGSLF